MNIDKKKLFNLCDLLLGLSRMVDSGFLKCYGVERKKTEHFFRTSILALLIAAELGLSEKDTYMLLIYSLIHDFHECFLGDISFIDRQSFDPEEFKKAKMRARERYLNLIPDSMANLLRSCIEYIENNEKLKQIAKDIDMLDYIISAKDLMNIGVSDADTHLKNAYALIKTKEIKKIAELLIKEWGVNKLWKDMQSVKVIAEEKKEYYEED